MAGYVGQIIGGSVLIFLLGKGISKLIARKDPASSHRIFLKTVIAITLILAPLSVIHMGVSGMVGYFLSGTVVIVISLLVNESRTKVQS